jgi:predicted ABC-type ATPase
VMLSGPNGAGKTTASDSLLQGPLKVDAFVKRSSLAGRIIREVRGDPKESN